MIYEPKEKPLHILQERKKGDIFIIESPMFRDRDNSDDDNVRLGVVFQNDKYTEHAHTILTIPLSSHISLRNEMESVVIKPDETNNLQYTVALQITEMRMFRKMHMKVKLGYLSDKDIQAANKAVKDFIGI